MFPAITLADGHAPGFGGFVLNRSISCQSLYRHQHWRVFVLHEEHQEFCWLGTACVPTYHMDIVGALVERLSRSQRHLLSALHLHHHGTFQHIDESMRIVPVDWIGIAGGILYYHHHSLLAGALLKFLRQE